MSAWELFSCLNPSQFFVEENSGPGLNSGPCLFLKNSPRYYLVVKVSVSFGHSIRNCDIMAGRGFFRNMMHIGYELSIDAGVLNTRPECELGVQFGRTGVPLYANCENFRLTSAMRNVGNRRKTGYRHIAYLAGI